MLGLTDSVVVQSSLQVEIWQKYFSEDVGSFVSCYQLCYIIICFESEINIQPVLLSLCVVHAYWSFIEMTSVKQE